MADALTILGGIIEAIGLVLVLVELAVVRSNELGHPLPWRQVLPWLRRTFWIPDRHNAVGRSTLTAIGSIRTRGRVRPGPLPSGTPNERIARLESYVEQIDRELNAVHDALERTADEVLAAAKEHADKIQLDAAARDQDRLDALVPSLRRQACGAALVLLGLGLQTVGGVW